MHYRLTKKTVFIFLLLLFVLSCGTVKTEGHQSAMSRDAEEIIFPSYDGDKAKVQVINLSIPVEILELYPELQDNRVGWGIYNRVVDTFYETKRFMFIEEKSEVKTKIFENWKLKASGITLDDEDFEIGNLQTPDYFIYVEIFDFSVRQNEAVVGIAAEEEKTTILGIQLRLVNAEDGTFIPASGIGEASSTSTTIWLNNDLEFDKSTVGLATERAVRSAVLKLLKRI